jgi:hypothetical protein
MIFLSGRRFVAVTAMSSATKIGSVAMSKAATPEGTVCSAQCRVPCPTRKKRKPTIRLARHWANVGRFPCDNPHANRIDPAIRCRKPAVNKGGIVSIA